MIRRSFKPLLPLLVGLVAVLLGFFAVGTASAAETPSRGTPATGPPTVQPVHDLTPQPGNFGPHRPRPGSPRPPTGDCASCVRIAPVD